LNNFSLTQTKSSTIKCSIFQMKNFFKICIYFIVIYCIATLLTFLLNFIGVTFNTSINGSNDTVTNFQISNMFVLPCIIFMFIALSSVYKQYFNYLLMMSNKRRNIMQSFLINIISAALFLSLISILMNLFAEISTKIFKYNKIDFIHFIYSKNINGLSEFLWSFALLLMIGSFGLLFGSLKYKLGKVFVIAFWVILGCSFNFIGILVESNLIPVLKNAFNMFFSIGNINGIYFSSINFIIAAMIFGCATYLIARRQEQKA